jgi:hypothetical protein
MGARAELATFRIIITTLSYGSHIPDSQGSNLRSPVAATVSTSAPTSFEDGLGNAANNSRTGDAARLAARAAHAMYR